MIREGIIAKGEWRRAKGRMVIVVRELREEVLANGEERMANGDDFSYRTICEVWNFAKPDFRPSQIARSS